MFAFGQPRRRRRPSLTPMIDVVFLLLVFFMLASRFGTDMHLPLSIAGSGGAPYSGPPRLVVVAPEGLKLNGVARAEEDLAAALGDLTEAPDDLIVLRAENDTPLQRMVVVMELLGDAGFTRLALVQ